MGGRRDYGHRIEPFWDAQLAVAVVIVLDATLPPELVFEARWLSPLISGLLLITVMWLTPWNSDHPPPRSPGRRRLSLAMVAVVIVSHVGSLAALVVEIVGHGELSGNELLRAAVQLWFATVLLFAVVYWEIDREGPVERSHNGPTPRPPDPAWPGPWPDFLFPQMSDDTPTPPTWMPGFVDYLYLAATNSTAFSPTDVMPLSHAAKLTMLLQSTSSFVLIALVAARAVNILT